MSVCRNKEVMPFLNESASSALNALIILGYRKTNTPASRNAVTALATPAKSTYAANTSAPERASTQYLSTVNRPRTAKVAKRNGKATLTPRLTQPQSIERFKHARSNLSSAREPIQHAAATPVTHAAKTNSTEREDGNCQNHTATTSAHRPARKKCTILAYNWRDIATNNRLNSCAKCSRTNKTKNHGATDQGRSPKINIRLSAGKISA